MLPKSQIEAKLDAEIISLLDKLGDINEGTEEYNKIVDRIVKLHKLKSDEIDSSAKLQKLRIDERLKLQISPDTVLIVIANIFGILWLTRYEKEHVINSKALGFIKRL